MDEVLSARMAPYVRVRHYRYHVPVQQDSFIMTKNLVFYGKVLRLVRCLEDRQLCWM
jgi:hypothetical protein